MQGSGRWGSGCNSSTEASEDASRSGIRREWQNDKNMRARGGQLAPIGRQHPEFRSQNGGGAGQADARADVGRGASPAGSGGSSPRLGEASRHPCKGGLQGGRTAGGGGFYVVWKSMARFAALLAGPRALVRQGPDAIDLAFDLRLAGLGSPLGCFPHYVKTLGENYVERKKFDHFFHSVEKFFPQCGKR